MRQDADDRLPVPGIQSSNGGRTEGHRSIEQVILLAVVMAFALAPAAAASDWPERRGQGRTGVQSAGEGMTQIPREGLQTVWRQATAQTAPEPSAESDRRMPPIFREHAIDVETAREYSGELVSMYLL